MSTIRVKKVYKDSKGEVISERPMTFTLKDWETIRKNPHLHDGAIFELMPTKVTEVKAIEVMPVEMPVIDLAPTPTEPEETPKTSTKKAKK